MKDGYYWIENLNTHKKEIVEVFNNKVSFFSNENQYKLSDLTHYKFHEEIKK